MERLRTSVSQLSHARRVLLALLLGFLVGIIWIIGLRVLLVRDHTTHYHANFGLFINGQQQKFESFGFYEEVASCGGDDANNPRIRVHLHKPDAHVVHVHDPAVTWGHLFANLGYTLGNDVLKTDEGLFTSGVAADAPRLRFMLNGEEVPAVANRVITDTDVLLVSYGTESGDALKAQYGAVPIDAGQFNSTADPAACAGSKPLTIGERFKRAFDLSR